MQSVAEIPCVKWSKVSEVSEKISAFSLAHKRSRNAAEGREGLSQR